MEEIASRQVAFRDLLRHVGQQLSQSDTSTIEFNERVPPQMRGKGGVMLLETLWKSGRFSPWKTQPLREVLRLADRCDLDGDTVKKYQMEFQDKDSPMSHHRPLERGTSTPVTGSPRLVHSHVRPHTAAPPSSPQWTPGHRRAQSDLPSMHSKESHATSELKHTLTEPHEEVGPSGPSMPSLPQSMQHFPTPYPYEFPGTSEYRGNGSHKHSNSMDKGRNIPPSTPEYTSNPYHEPHSLTASVSSSDVSSHPTPGNSYCELGMKVIDAIKHVVNVVASTSQSEVSCSASSFSSLHSHLNASQTSLQSTPRTRHSGKTALPQSWEAGYHQHMAAHGRPLPAHRGSLPTEKQKFATLPRNFSSPAWNRDTDPEILGEMDLDDTSGGREPHQTSSTVPLQPQTSSPAKEPEKQSREHTELPSELPTAPPEVTSRPENLEKQDSNDSVPGEPTRNQQRPTSAKDRIKSLLKRQRPPSAHRTSAHNSYQWRVKREEMVKSIYRHSHAKLRCISCPSQLELDAAHHKHNTKLSLKLYPYGLFEDEGKNVSLQVNIATPKKSPPISPSLQMRFTVIVLDDQGKTLRQRSTLQSLNMNVFYVASLLTHDELIKGLQGECVELRASVQIEQQSV